MSRWILYVASLSSVSCFLTLAPLDCRRRLISIPHGTARSFPKTLVWAILDIVAQAKFLTLFALLFGAGLQMLLPRGKQWIQSRLTLLVLLGFIHALFFWDGDILLAYGLVGLICWRLVRDAPSVKACSIPAYSFIWSGLACYCCWAWYRVAKPAAPDAGCVGNIV